MLPKSDKNVPPDGGWGWLVVFGAHCTRALSAGILYACGPFIDEWLDYFDQSAAITTWIFAFAALMMSVVSLFIGGLTEKLGIRPIVILGGVFIFFGFLFSAFAQRIEHLFITVEIMIGSGIGMVNAPSLLIVGVYFKRNFNFAHGLVMVGSSIGQLIFATLFAYLQSSYGWRGTCLIFAALTANLMVCGALFRFLRPLRRHSKIDHIGNDYRDSGVKQEILTANGVTKEHVNTPLRESDYLHTHDIHKKKRKRTSNWCFQSLRRFGEVTVINICFDNFIFTLYQICSFLQGAGAIIPMAHLVNKVVLGGISKDNAAMLITISAIGNLLSRASHGWFIDKGFVAAHTLYLMASIFCAVETLTFMLTNIYGVLAVLSFLYGFHFGITAGLQFSLPRFLVSQKQVSSAVGLTLFVNSVGLVIGPPFAGWLFDITGNYTASFCFGAGIFGLLAIFFVPIYLYLWRQTQSI